jgi:hypothetical protein
MFAPMPSWVDYPMPDTEIRPALTPEEWAHPEWHDGTGFYIVRKPGAVVLILRYPNDELPPETIGIANPSGAAHALAACLLHGQPFGFDRDDLWLLDQAIMDSEADGRVEIQIERMRLLYAKLAALLPPED